MPIDLNEAIELHRRGDLDRAASLYESALAVEPMRDDALHLLGLIALQRGDPGRAVTLINRAIAIRGDVADHHASLAEAFRLVGQLDRSIASGREAIRLDPANAALHGNLGATLVDRGDLDAGLASFRVAIRLDPHSAATHNNLGNLLRIRGDSAAAIDHFRASIRLDPTSPEVHANLALILLDRGDPEAALEPAREAIRIRPDSSEARINLGNILQVLGRLEEAEVCLNDAIRIRPGSSAAHASLGGVLEQAGDPDRAMIAFREALRLDPEHAGVLARLATRLRDRLPDADQVAIEDLLARPNLAPDRRIPLLFGLTQVHDARGTFDRAAELSLEANARQCEDFVRKGRGYDPDGHARFVDRILASFGPAFFDRVRGWGLATERPVFIVGMPRSGTSLVEQILASHPRVFGAGELRLAGQSFGQLGESLDQLDRTGLERMARRHLDGLDRIDPSSDRIIDKMPENTLYLGLIAAMFPSARLIHCRRGPRDVALSCWMTHFGQVRWSCDPDHIATRIAESDRLMAHWKTHLRVFEIDYEEVVEDLESKARELVAWCGLDWSPACLEFHQTRRPVRTASVEQVRRPIYRGSVGRWRNYERSLAPLFARL